MDQRAIAVTRLRRQRLWGAPLGSAAEVVGWLAAVQAQDFFGSKWGLAQRISGTDEAAMDGAFASGEILRTHLLRPTWHFVTPADIRGLLALTGPRVHARSATMYRRVGADTDTMRRVEAVVQRELTGRAVSRPAVQQAIADAGVDVSVPMRMSHLLMHLELDGMICSGPRIGNQFSYRLLDDIVGVPAHLDLTAVAVDLALRYVRSRGPATAHDMATWSGLTVTACRAALADNRPALVESTVDGVTYWDAAEPAAERPHPPRALLLSIYDEYIAGYRDRVGAVDPADITRLRLMGNDLTGVVTLDARLVGTWKRRTTGDGLAVVVSPFHDLADDELATVEEARRRLSDYTGDALVDC
jgi:DNA glycosylase AlkZ-like